MLRRTKSGMGFTNTHSVTVRCPQTFGHVVRELIIQVYTLL